ncbi:MAG: TIGR04283 family arsenosugar biosynthesis glycosyltransferase [Nitrospirae bacterium]|nr:TIGR04283 family arsenosugar biosynthesis glycosyltransferase [Nitrospirota bacterium]
MKISIIIPVLNEEKILSKTLSSINLQGNELIIVDGGSTDNTLEIANKFTDKIISSKKGRGAQLSAGAGAASHNILFILHADCIPPQNTFDLIRKTLNIKGVSAGSFMFGIDLKGIPFRIIELAVFVRSLITRIPYGDQGLFMTKAAYQEIGGFNDLPIMEDIDIAQRLKKHGRIVFLREKMIVSARRWLKEGILYTTLRDWSIALMYTFFNINPKRLIRHYKDVR